MILHNIGMVADLLENSFKFAGQSDLFGKSLRLQDLTIDDNVIDKESLKTKQLN